MIFLIKKVWIDLPPCHKESIFSNALGLVFLSLFRTEAVSCSVTQPETVHLALIVLGSPLQENPSPTPNLRRASLQM